ncbi:MAG: Holliday junction resolvase Hjc [Candidatus Diapherotrites archaeon]
MTYYAKGANAERELIHILFEKGFSVVRAAGSAATALPCPDIIALNKEKRLAFECKAWSSTHLSIPSEQMKELISWGERAGTETYVAWKIPNKGWLFLKPQAFNKTPKHFIISKKKAFTKSLELNVITGRQAVLK